MNELKHSMFSKFDYYLFHRYGYQLDMEPIAENLKEKLAEDLPSSNRLVRKQMEKIILPAVSIYQELEKAGVKERVILKWMKHYVLCYYRKGAKVLHMAGQLPCFPTLFRIFFPKCMKMYPQGEWDIKWKKHTKNEETFDMTDCLYYRTFKKYGCEKVTAIFCSVDDQNYLNMSPKVDFIRTKTLGRDGDCCDFKFVIRD